MRLGRFIARLRPHAGALAVATGLLVTTAAVPAAVVALVHEAVTQLSAGSTDLGSLAGGLVALAAGHAIAMVARTALTKRVAWRVAEELRRDVHRAYLRGRPDGELGDRLVRLGDEIDQAQYGVSALVTALRNPLALIGLLAVTLALAPRAMGWAVALGLPIVAVAALGGRAVRRWTQAQRRARADWSTVTTAQLGALETLQALGAEADEEARFAKVTAADRQARIRLDVGRTLPVVGVQVVVALAIGGLVAQGPGFTNAVVLVTALTLAQRPLAGLAEVWALLQRSLAALERVDEALATAPRISEPIHPTPLPEGPLTLRWDHVTVVRDERRILDGVSSSVRPGEIVALVGPTGAGKTTLLRLAWRAFDPEEGRVWLGEVDLREVRAADRHGAIALVPQDVVLWGRTVAENLTMGLAPGAVDRNDLAQALRDAKAEFVLDWPEGLDTRLAEDGRGLSGGERQRICVARALVRNARVWLLDEPTSHVDAGMTDELGQTLRDAAPDRTIVVVAHDPALVAWADRVVRIEGGRCAD